MFEYLLATPAEQLIANSEVMMAFAFAISIISLSYMAGEFMTMPTLRGFAKAELYELGVTAVILVLLLLLVIPNGPFDIVARGFGVPGPNGGPPLLCEEWLAIHGPLLTDQHGYYAKNGNIAFGQANFFLGCSPKLYIDWNPFDGIPEQNLNGVLGSRLLKAYSSLMLTQMFTGLLAGFNTGLEISLFKVLAVNVGITPWVALGPLNQAHTTIVDLIGTAYSVTVAENMLLKFIEKAAIFVFLPFGLMLRAFPFSRRTGSTVIAVAVAAYFIFPMSILLNEQIWLLIVSPPSVSNPQCLAVGTAGCQIDSDCCSYDCRFSKSSGQNTCMSPLTDFSEYRSIYSLCDGNPTPEEIDQKLDELAEKQDKRVLELYFTGDPSQTEPTKQEQRLKDGLGTVAGRHTNSFWQFAQSLLNPMPKHTAQTVFSEIEVLVTDAGQYALLVMLFLVVSIVISLTMMKDIAILIGGEPRVFGLSKLV